MRKCAGLKQLKDRKLQDTKKQLPTTSTQSDNKECNFGINSEMTENLQNNIKKGSITPSPSRKRFRFHHERYPSDIKTPFLDNKGMNKKSTEKLKPRLQRVKHKNLEIHTLQDKVPMTLKEDEAALGHVKIDKLLSIQNIQTIDQNCNETSPSSNVDKPVETRRTGSNSKYPSKQIKYGGSQRFEKTKLGQKISRTKRKLIDTDTIYLPEDLSDLTDDQRFCLELRQNLAQKNLTIKNLKTECNALQSQLAKKRFDNHEKMWFPRSIKKTVSKDTIDLTLEEIEKEKENDITPITVLRNRIKDLAKSYQNEEDTFIEDYIISQDMQEKVQAILKEALEKQEELTAFEIDTIEPKQKDTLNNESISSILDEVCQMTAKAFESKERFCNLCEKITCFREKYIAMMQKIQVQQCTISKLKSDQIKSMEELDKKLQAAKSDLKQQQQKITDSQKSIRKLKLNISQICMEKKEMHEELLDLCRQLRSMNRIQSRESISCENCERLQDKIDDQQAVYDKLQSETDDIIENNQELKNEVNLIRSNLARKIVRFKKNLKNRRFYLKTYVHHLKINIRKTKSMAMKSLSKRNAKIDELRDELDSLYCCYSKAQNVLETLKD